MKLIRATTIVAALSIASITLGYADESASQKFSKEELHKLVREAHSVDQYRQLASYFRARQIKLQQQAQAERAEWQRRSQDISSVSMKYPRPVDSSRNRYEYFMYEAGQMDQEASHYENLASATK
ncbi:MAG TPA: hypothetical protein VK716_07890 [Terracidiphilus sp.]|jgi:hypothetical protein|nr:hypothetical protein [Terracidiphilus sp.]